ncbi:hypothetical protein AB205_0218690 [Aquarana catesbeiana]|uniref:G-protein coupled receptors family 1 profile domain-containing protein n=1 Tax=Aquarana catesbeiana TaxID=8400 RepID=A0A2G9S6H0_AQUCT|nr:hypothetical protein AB205_0218690 [Aquarana catesbeiana]
MFIFNSLGATECYLLLVLAFDRDLAINSPLRYSAIMRKGICTQFAVAPFIVDFYTHIINSILKITGNEGKQKAYSTCSSDLFVTSLFFGVALVVYFRPTGSENEKFLAHIYMVLTPHLNPLIYTFRNSDVKMAITNSVLKKIYLSCSL